MPDTSTSLTAQRTAVKGVRFIFFALLIIVLMVQISLAVIFMMAQRSANDSEISLDQIVTIQTGMTGTDIGNLLEENGIVSNKTLFTLMLYLTKTDDKLQAGEYLLNPVMSVYDIINKLETGISITQRVTIPEGYDLKQIAARLGNQDLVDEERFLKLALDAELVYGDQLTELGFDLPIKSLEGYLFPDTYHFAKEQTEEAIIRQMVARFVDHVIPQVDLTLMDHRFSLHELVTLASIVEKEVIMNFERPIVAAVYLNRLDINMRLQADPTVRYVMTEDRDRVLYRDLEIESPYNTYRNSGLPPGPIASPGLRSILAVLEPADVDYFYFVSRRDGTHQFSRTFEEHVAARLQLGY